MMMTVTGAGTGGRLTRDAHTDAHTHAHTHTDPRTMRSLTHSPTRAIEC